MEVQTALTVSEWLFISLYFFVLIGLSIYGSHRYHMAWLYWRHRDDPPLPPQSDAPKAQGSRPKVLIQLPVFNERYVVERLIDQVVKMRYPNNLLEIHEFPRHEYRPKIMG